MRAYGVEVDGAKVGSLKPGEQLQIPLSPGTHQVRFTIDWCSSPTVMVDGESNPMVECRPNGTALAALSDVLFRKEQYIHAQLIEP